MSDSWFPLELTRPYWLAGLVVLPVLLYYFVHSLADFPRWQRWLSLAGRSLIVLLLILSLAGLTLRIPTKRQYILFAVDRSLSVGEESRKAAEAFVRKAAELAREAGDNGIGYVEFAAAPGMVQDGKTEGPPPSDDKGTNIASAIEVAAAAIPPFFVPKIVLLSDGNQTAGDALKAALRTGVPVWTVPLATRDEPEVVVSAVKVPAQVPQEEPFHVEVVIDANRESEGDIEVFRNEHKVVSERKRLRKGENRFRFRQQIDQERLARFTVRVRGFQDTRLDNNSDFGLVFTSGKPRVLLIENDPVSRDLVWALEKQGIQVDVRPSRGMPDNLADLQNYELLILSNVPATELSVRKMEVARTYVQDLGGGLIMLGGEQSFGLGGYYKTVLEEILPVRSDFEKEQEKPSLAMMLVIDKSGSMGGEKIELAKDAARGAIELLGRSDKVGVIAFEGEPYFVSEMHPCDDKGFVLDRVASIEAGGGTNMAPAMEEAFDALNQTQAKLKHVIILTDGISAPGDFEGIAEAMARERITITTVGVGEGADQALLEEIARIGNGRYYFTDDPYSIPQIFAKETVAASKSAINELPFVPLVYRPTPSLADIEFADAPPLLGYVVTRPKPTSEVILVTEDGDPLLSWWRYGLGEVVAFTSDAKSRWAADWISWSSFGPFWAQVVRHAMRKDEAKGVVIEVEPRDSGASVRLDAIEPSGKFLNGADSELTVIDPRFGSKRIAMSQTAPGRYEARFETPTAGAYHLEFSQTLRGNPLYHQSRGLAVGYPDELRLKPTNEELLRSIAQASAGRYSPTAEEVVEPPDRTARRALPLWPYLVASSSLIFVADVALRRIDFSLVFGGIVRRISLSPGRR